MRLHEAAPKLIIQERVGDKVKVSSYWPVPELTRAELALGRLHLSRPDGSGPVGGSHPFQGVLRWGDHGPRSSDPFFVLQRV